MCFKGIVWEQLTHLWEHVEQVYWPVTLFSFCFLEIAELATFPTSTLSTRITWKWWAISQGFSLMVYAWALFFETLTAAVEKKKKKKEGNQVRTLTIRLFFPGLVYLQKCLKSMGTPSLPILLLSVSIFCLLIPLFPLGLMSSDSGKRKIPWGVSPSNLDCIIQVRVVGKVLFRVLILGVIFFFCFTPPPSPTFGTVFRWLASSLLTDHSRVQFASGEHPQSFS